MERRERGGLYVHVPFCASKCPYCHFYSVPPSEAGLRAWREGLAAESAAAASAAAGEGLRFDTLYFGGGTPSLLGPDDVARVRDLALARFPLEPAEFTLEANPAAAATDRLRGWREAGITRLSVGAQSFDDDVLRALGRAHTAGEGLRFCLEARQAGFEALAVDLMTGIPGETPGALDRSLAALREIGPDHVSLYLLENVEGLPFAEVLARRPVDEDAAIDGFLRAAGALEAAGLRRYEISNFARPGRECRHNLKYWRHEPFVGLGPSSSSHLGGRRWTNLASLEDWSEALVRGGDARAETVELDPEASALEALVFGLRLVEGVDAEEVARRTGVDVLACRDRETAELAAEGLLVREGTRLRIPADKLLVSNAILSRLI